MSAFENEDSSQQEKNLFANLLSSSPDLIYFKDRTGRFVKVNHALARFLGLADPNDALGKTDFDFYSEEQARTFYEDEQFVISTGEGIVGKEEQQNWPDGRLTWASTTKGPLRDSAGNIIGIMGISRDITERKNAEMERDNILRELQDAFTRIKTLSGLLPICATCKKIRDDQGSWLEVESYISKKSDANFSHGICPECLNKMYPDMPEKR